LVSVPTIWAARGGFEEEDKGSVAVGKLGDFAVLSDDPCSLPREALFDLQVDATIVGGEVVFERI
jgi:predicted amidohydrolase YtcJ